MDEARTGGIEILAEAHLKTGPQTTETLCDRLADTRELWVALHFDGLEVGTARRHGERRGERLQRSVGQRAIRQVKLRAGLVVGQRGAKLRHPLRLSRQLHATEGASEHEAMVVLHTL